jgi:hypothetical protein
VGEPGPQGPSSTNRRNVDGSRGATGEPGPQGPSSTNMRNIDAETDIPIGEIVQ